MALTTSIPYIAWTQGGQNFTLIQYKQLFSIVRPDPPEGVLMSEMFGSDSATVILQWSSPTVASGVSYNVNVTPPLESVLMAGNTSVQLTVPYNTEYNVSIVTINCAGKSPASVTSLLYGN